MEHIHSLLASALLVTVAATSAHATTAEEILNNVLRQMEATQVPHEDCEYWVLHQRAFADADGGQTYQELSGTLCAQRTNMRYDFSFAQTSTRGHLINIS